MNAVERLRNEIHLESARIAPQTSGLIEAAKIVLDELERLQARQISGEPGELMRVTKVIYEALEQDNPDVYMGPLELGDADNCRTTVDGQFNLPAVARRILDSLTIRAAPPVQSSKS